jgi:hypothetical protein
MANSERVAVGRALTPKARGQRGGWSCALSAATRDAHTLLITGTNAPTAMNQARKGATMSEPKIDEVWGILAKPWTWRIVESIVGDMIYFEVWGYKHAAKLSQWHAVNESSGFVNITERLKCQHESK